MTGNSPRISSEATEADDTPQLADGPASSSTENRGIVAVIPVEAVRGRVMTSLSSPSPAFAEAAPVSKTAESAFERALEKATLEEALSAIREAYPHAEGEIEAFTEFLNEYRTVFVLSGRRSNPKMWEQVRNHPTFEIAVIEYLKKMVPAIFKNKYSRSLYEDIEYGLFLLGSAQNFDILEDIRHGGMQGLSGLFAKCHSAVSRGLSAAHTLQIRDSDPFSTRDGWDSFERKVSAFEQLCEIINKIAAMHSISALDKDRALSLIRMIAAQIEAVGNELDNVGFDPLAKEKLRFIEGKLLGNYSHLEFFDGKSAEEILRKADKICSAIERGFELQRSTRFGGVPQREGIATSVKLWNLASVKLTAVAKIKKLWKTNRETEEIEKEWIDVLFDLYAEASKGGKTFYDAEDVAIDFVSRGDHDEFMIETMHHLMLFCDLAPETLCRVATKLIGDDQYHNAFHEEFKIKLFTVILEKLRLAEQSERTTRVAYWMREYARKNEKESGLVMSFSQLYISLAVFFSALPGDASKKSAMECYLRASRVTDEGWHLKFESQETAFLNAIGGRKELERFEQIHSLEKKCEIHERLLELIAKAVHGTQKDEANRAVCEIIEEFFYGICIAEIQSCDCDSMSLGVSLWSCGTDCTVSRSAKTVRRGNRSISIPLGRGHNLLLQYPANLESVFNRILDQRRDFIKTNISMLLRIIMKDHELSEANQYLADAFERLERQYRTDALTGLPNMRQYEDDLPLFEDMPRVSSLLVKVENLSEINGAYGMDTGSDFIRKIASDLIREFFGDRDNWKVYRTAPKEFLIIGDYHTEKTGISFEDVIPHFYEMCSVFTFFPKTERLPWRGKDGLCLRAQVSLSFSNVVKTDIYKKLHIAMQDTLSWPKVVAFNEEHHSEERVRKNIEGATAVTEAIAEKRIIPYYQAIVDNKTGRVVKFECLARMVDREGTIHPPYAFVDHAKRAGTIPLLTRLMSEQACQDLQYEKTHFSVNISWQDLADPDLVSDLIKLMAKYEIDPGRVTLEILEEALLSNHDESAAKIAQLKKLGCKIALDDFGSEWSNFSRFEKEWWPDVIKLDGPKFIMDLDKSPEKRQIVRAMVKAGQELGCEIVAERVDSVAIWELVTEMGIQYSQGYLFHKPAGFPKTGEGLPAAIDLTELRLRTKTSVSGTLSIPEGP